MNDVDALLQRYAEASAAHTRRCSRDPSVWHRPNTDEFTALRALLTAHAESGDIRCQYALAIIYWLGLCYESEEQYYRDYEETIQIATYWWGAAASQGHWAALDNLITCGVGMEADRVREAFHQFEQQRRDLVGWSQHMPVYGIDFMQEFCRMVYGRVVTDEA